MNDIVLRVGAGVVGCGVGPLVGTLSGGQVTRRALLYRINTFNHPPRATTRVHSTSLTLFSLTESEDADADMDTGGRTRSSESLLWVMATAGLVPAAMPYNRCRQPCSHDAVEKDPLWWLSPYS